MRRLINLVESAKTLTESSKLDALIARLNNVGGKVYAKITNGTDNGVLGYNGSGKKKVYFAFYDDGTNQRFEHPVQANDLKPGWEVVGGDMRDPETAAADSARQAKAAAAAAREAKFTQTIRLDFKQIEQLCELGGVIVDAYPESLYHSDPDDIEDIDGREVATVEYCINIRNPEYDREDPDASEIGEFYDPIRFKFWRDAKNPDVIHAEQI
jgi:hypothetical protein